jgi:hypothetical protein
MRPVVVFHVVVAVLLWLAVPSVTPPEPVLPEPVYLIDLGCPEVAGRPVPVPHPREPTIEYAMAYTRLAALAGPELADEELLLAEARGHLEPIVLPRVFAPRLLPRNVEFWRALLAEYDWPIEEALAIVGCESSGDPNIVSRTNDWGLFQHHWPYWSERSRLAGFPNSDPLDPRTNVAVAYWLYNDYSGRSWSHWTCGTILGLP